MRASDRVQAWRQRMRNEGKEPMTIWVGRDEKLRLEDLARTWRCSPSDLVQQALAHFHPTSPHVTATVTDTEQLRALIQAELGASSLVTATITDTVTATLPHLVHGLVQDMFKEHATATVAATVADTDNVAATDTATVTDTSALAEAVTPSAGQHQRGRQPGPLRQQILTLLAAHAEGLSAEEIRAYVKPEKPIGDTLQGMRKGGVVKTHGRGKDMRYVVA